MAINSLQAFGLRDVKITDLDGSNPVDLPVGRYLRFADVPAVATFDLDGVTVGVEAKTARVEWEIEAGAISLAAVAKLRGLSATLTGSSPNEVLTLEQGVALFPYVRIYGQSLGDAGDDVHCKILKAKCTALEGTLRGESFVISTCRGIAVPDAAGVFMQVVVHETQSDF